MPLTLERPARCAASVPALLVLLAGAVAGGTVLCSPWLRSEPWAPGVGEVVQDAVYALSAALVLVRVALVTRERPAWALLAAGLACYGTANTYYYAYVQHWEPEPFPSPADPAWLAFYPLAYGCIVLLLRARVVRWHASTWLDGLVAACGLGAIAVALVFAPVLVAGQGNRAATAVALAYPVSDLLLLVLLIGALAVMGWRAGPVWWLLGAGLSWFVLGDAVFLLQSASQQGYGTGGWVDVTWLFGVALMGTASWVRNPDRPAGRLQGSTLLTVPLVFAGASILLLVQGSLRHAASNPLATGLAGATSCLALARLGLTFREVRTLAEARSQARTDELTGLANRRAFLEQLDAIGRAASSTLDASRTVWSAGSEERADRTAELPPTCPARPMAPTR